MKNRKRDLGPITRALRSRRGYPETALDHLAIYLKSDESDAHFDRAALAALTIGLFVLGLDEFGDACLVEVTDALFGKDSDDATRVFNAIVLAGDAAHDTQLNATRRRVRAGYRKMAEAAGTAEAGA